VVGRYLEVDESSFARDTKEAIDYELALPAATVACRIRRVETCKKWRDLTISTESRGGAIPESSKLAGGQVHWYLYAWADEERFVDWMVVDVARVLREGLMDRAMLDRDEVFAPGGRFLYIAVEKLQRADAILGASWLP
jgi:hypothetical protein